MRSSQWFHRAASLMALRVPGGKPFHLTVRFQAYPGQQLLGPGEKSDFVTGDGVYDELWLAPDHWRREVTLADYHAVEVEANGFRKMQASSDYVPSRVLMLLSNLYNPLPDGLTNGSLRATDWKIDHVASGSLNFVRLSKDMFATQEIKFSDSYYFLANGTLAMSNAHGIVTLWSNDIQFADRVVPKSLIIQVGDRKLLSAQISIEPAEESDPSAFDLPSSAADPGMTLQPLDVSAVKFAQNGSLFIPRNAGPESPHFYIIRGVLDRTGALREVELIWAQDPTATTKVLRYLRGVHGKPDKIGRSPCEFVMIFQFI